MDAPILYFYDQNGYFTETRTAERDPLDSCWLIPFGATDIVILPEKKGFVQQFKNDKWSYIENHVGEVYYHKQTGEKITITEAGALPDDLTEKEYPDPYATWSDDFNNWWISPADGMRKQRDQAEVEKNRLIALAEQRVNDLTEATDESVFEPDEIDLADIELLKQWKRYRVFIKRVDTTALIINWPELPEPEKKELNND